MLGTLREAWRKSRAINNLEKPLIVDNFDTNIEAKRLFYILQIFRYLNNFILK